ncbi:MAG: response regulator transcription factor [Rhodospirillales bacterium]|nr:response regulator transcription factor [Rhodospirillales bacterium]
MKILVVDRDRLSSQFIHSRLTAQGHQVVEESVKNEALDRLKRESFDAVFIDPAPLTNARPVVLGIRRSTERYPYVILMSHNGTLADAVSMGANDVLIKPIDGAELDLKVLNARRLTDLVARIGDDSEDFPSAGGVISKSAFNQLFLSAIDRADRYGEKSFIVFITLKNYDSILQTTGAYGADYTVAKMAQYLVRMRRQSDIIAQTARHEYALLLQRPQYETEPVEAANRFAESLSKYDDILSSSGTPGEISVRLVSLPVGAQLIEHAVGGGAGTGVSQNSAPA